MNNLYKCISLGPGGIGIEVSKVVDGLRHILQVRIYLIMGFIKGIFIEFIKLELKIEVLVDEGKGIQGLSPLMGDLFDQSHPVPRIEIAGS